MKWSFIKNIILKDNIQFVCLQETKNETCNKEMCQAIWSDCEMKWVMQPSINVVGGLLYLWSEDFFTLHNLLQGDGYIGLEGLWKEGGFIVTLINIYSPCELDLKRRLWKDLKSKESSTCDMWCIMGDFNCVRRPCER